MMTDISKKQYIWSSKRIINLHTMQEYFVCGGYLYVHKELNLEVYADGNGNTLYLLGYAFCMDNEGKKPYDDISKWDGKNTKELTKFWTGRWVLFTKDELINDACGMMSVFYYKNDDEKYISSSLSLICDCADLQIHRSVEKEGLNWHILPNTIVDKINAMLCTQKIVFNSNDFEVDFYDWIESYGNLSTRKKCERISEYLTNGLRNIALYSNRDIYLALTGGKDSRVVLSALLKSKVSFASYTLEHNDISSSDKNIPATLSKKYSFRHKYIKKKKLDNSALIDYYRFTGNNCKGIDAQFYSRQQFADLPDNAILVRSAIFEVGQTYARSIAREKNQCFFIDMQEYYSSLKVDMQQNAAFNEWIDYVEQHPISNIDIRDRFYIEQRVGGWAASIEQSMDLNEFISIQIANCATIISILASATNEEREELSLGLGIIKINK